MVGPVGKISVFRPQGPQFYPGFAEIWILCDLFFSAKAKSAFHLPG